MLLACARPWDTGGVLVDARTGAPIAGATVRLRTEAEGDCALREAGTDPEGRFELAGLCGGHAYRAAPADPLWWVAVEPEVQAGGRVELRAWRAPTSDGVYLLEGTELRQLTTQTGVSERMWAPAGRNIAFPTELPETLPAVRGEAALVLAGEEVVAGWSLQPTWDGPELSLGPAEAPVKMWPWVYLGAKIREDGALEELKVEATSTGPDARPLRYFGADAVPAGRYALRSPGKSRAFLLMFGDTPPGG